jgi:hypothetical protein
MPAGAMLRPRKDVKNVRGDLVFFFEFYHQLLPLRIHIFFFLRDDGIPAPNLRTQNDPKDPKHSAGICHNFRQSFSSVDASESYAW